MHYWPSKQVLKTSPLWVKAGKGLVAKEWKYDMLDLSDKDREQIAIDRQKRIERKAKKKAESN